MKIWWQTLLFPFLLLPIGADAEQLPSRTRGLSADSVYQVGDIDQINLFNGNLSLTIPVGPSYPVSPQISYRLTLVYNSNVWDFEDDLSCVDASKVVHNYSFPFPVPSANAGVGWSLHFGRLHAPNDPIFNKNNGSWLYVGPDGSQHNFYDKLHPTEAATPGVFYSLDGSYLRLKTAGQPVIESPDGLRRSFTHGGATNSYRLTEVRDRFDNWMQVAYTATIWTISDSQGRSHEVAVNPAGNVTSVSLEAFGGQTATYTLVYTDSSLERHRFTRAICDLEPGHTENVNAPLLTQLEQPDGTRFDFSYDIDDSTSINFSGALRKAVLPTRGRIEWDYSTYGFQSQAPTVQLAAMTQQKGVGARRTYLDATTTTAEASWEYAHSIGHSVPSGPYLVACNHRMRVSNSESAEVTDSYFATAGGSDQWWYGLPYSPCPVETNQNPVAWSADNDAPYLSTRTYEKLENGTLVPIRSTYVIYDSDGRDSGPNQDRNHRVRYQKVVYHDDLDENGEPHFVETAHSDFDGLGHYRSVSSTSSFGPEKILATSYLPAGSYQLHPDTGAVITDTFDQPSTTAAWLWGLSTGSTTTIGTAVSKREMCFDATTGFLERQRILAGSNQQAQDLVVEFEEGSDANSHSGFVVAERIYGGDSLAANVETGPLCNLSLSSPAFVKRNNFENGGLTRSAWVEPCDESSEVLVTEEATIDPGTGLPNAVVESNGLEVSLDYDLMGRLLAEVPAEGASRIHFYDLPTPSHTVVPSYEIRQCPQGTTTFCNTSARYSDRYWEYDGLGRLARQAVAYPGASGDTDSDMKFTLDGLGRKIEETTWGQAKKTVFSNFDVFGRARTIAPEGTSSTLFTFRGDRIAAREVKVAKSAGLQSVFTTEVQDHLGRLVAVCDGATSVWDGHGSCTGQLTRYSYDQDDRLSHVCQNVVSNVCGQQRSFVWDGRGFLMAETHPEIGAFGNGTISYLRDARGNPIYRDIVNDNGEWPVAWNYDRAGRPTVAYESVSTGWRKLKEFFYARENQSGSTEKRRGQLIMARRINYLALLTPLLLEGGIPLTVTDHFEYDGLGGRVSKKTTSISLPSGSQSWSSSFTWDAIGDLASVTYPSGGWPYQNAPARTVDYDRRLGFLKSIPGYATNISYQLGGMPFEIKYANNVTWRQTAEADTGWERPDQIDTLNGSNVVLWSTGDYGYDGVGNISKIGTRAYTYDAFSRLEAVKVNGQPTAEQAATYDNYGNLISLSRNGVARSLTANLATNRLTTSGTVYTSNGEIEKVTIDGQNFEYGHDGLGQQIFHKTTGKTWVYAYDASDERVLSWECALDKCGDGTAFERYTLRGLGGEVLRSFEGPERSQLAWKEDYIYRDGQALSWIKSNGAGGEERLYLHTDHLGSTRLVTNAAGAQVSRHDFLPFGEESTATSGGDVALKFTGHERDQPGKPIDYMHARFCSPVLARFMRVDPAGGSAQPSAPQTWNRYAYVGNNPIKYVDPNGEAAYLVIVGSSMAGNDLFNFDGSAGHAALWVTSESGNAGISYMGTDFHPKGGLEMLVYTYAEYQGRTTEVYELKTTPEMDTKMVEALKADKNIGLGEPEVLTALTKNCVDGVCKTLKAGDVANVDALVPAQLPGKLKSVTKRKLSDEELKNMIEAGKKLDEKHGNEQIQ